MIEQEPFGVTQVGVETDVVVARFGRPGFAARNV
jgi:hypothetical protein